MSEGVKKVGGEQKRKRKIFKSFDFFFVFFGEELILVWLVWFSRGLLVQENKRDDSVEEDSHRSRGVVK